MVRSRRVRRRETKGDNPQCPTSSKKRRTDPFSMIPLDLIVMILLKVPAKTVARLVFVSKQWSSIIRGKDFVNLYLDRSSSRMRLLCKVFCLYVNVVREQFLLSCSQDDPSSDHRRLNITPHPTCKYDFFSPPVRGLICRQLDAKVTIGNPSTGQFLTLPRVKTTRRGVFSFLGYDPVNDVYKVLCMTVLGVCQKRGSRVVSEEHQVYTLGAKQKWRMIKCKRPHLPDYYTSKSICINGVLYYYAWIKNDASLISFDLISEEFNVIKLPEDDPCVVNYTGKVALHSRSSVDGTLHLWVLEGASKKKWSKVSLRVPSWIDIAGPHRFSFRGILRSGELIFSPGNGTRPYYFISYDPKENNAKKVAIQGIGDNLASLDVYFDHVDSPMLLSK